MLIYPDWFREILRQLRTVGIVGSAGLFMIATSYLLATQEFTNLSLIFIVVLLGLSAIYWRSGVYLTLIVTFVEGFARNYFNNPVMLLVKDLILVVVYARVFGERLLAGRPLFYKASFNLPLALLLALAVMQIFNPNSLSILLGLVGLRSGFLYMPLVFLVPELLPSRQALEKFSQFVLLVALPVSIYGIVQFYQGPEAYYSLGPGFQQATFITIGEFNEVAIYRPNSTFSWPSQYAVFLSFVFLYALGQSFQKRSWLRWLAWAELPLLVYAILIEGQRTDFVLLPLAVFGLFLLTRRITVSLKLLVPMLIGIVLILNTAAGAIFLDRFSTVSQNKDDVIFARLGAGWGNTVNGLTLSPIGVGTGMATLGAQYVTNTTIPYFFEGYYGKMAAELGWAGFALFLALLVAIAKFLLQNLKQIRRAEERWLALPLVAFIAIVYYKNFITNHLDLAVVSIFFWMSIGYVYTLKILASQNADKA